MFTLGSLVLTMLTSTTVPAADVAKIADQQPSKLVVIALDRKQPISHRVTAPEAWLKATDRAAFTGQSQPGEFYVFQISVVSSVPVESLKLKAVLLKDKKGNSIQGICFNTYGIDPEGHQHIKRLSLDKARVQMLWVGFDIPKDAKGEFAGIIDVHGGTPQNARVDVKLLVAGKTLTDHGDADAWRLSRLRWLNSKIGQDRSITKPYTPLTYKGRTIRNLTHQIELDEFGFIKQSSSYLDQAGKTTKTSTPLLTDKLQFSLKTEQGNLPIQWGKMQWLYERADEAGWTSTGKAGDVQVVLTAKWGFDGLLIIDFQVASSRLIDLSDVRLEAQIDPHSAEYIAGIGVEGRKLSEPVDWKWNIEKHQDTVWTGSVNNGCNWRFKGGNYHLPLCNIYYPFGKLANPDSWNNQGQGGITIQPGNTETKLTAYSGKCQIKPIKPLNFGVEMRLTPVKPIDTDEHWSTRYYHSGGADEKVLEEVKPGGFNTYNLHQGNALNPFINYPYSEEAFPDMLAFIRKAQAKRLRVKLYYTTRELTQNLPELDALYSLNGEVIFPGPGEKVRTVLHPNGPDPWLKEHFDGDYIPAWVQPLDGKLKGRIDLAVITTPESRWNNFYLEGLDYLVKKGKIDGLYIDDSALDRLSLLRARRILDSQRPSAMIDLHSWNHFNDLAGYACNVLMYVNLFPFIDRIWFGEGFDYNRSPDYWLVEMSGLPFGQMGEMLQDGGNPWRGMLFGMTQRLPWSGDPRPLWAFWDRFGMQGTLMLGWWDSRCPVQTNSKDVLATVYKDKGKALIAVASWSQKVEQVTLKIDWAKLGRDPKKVEAKIEKIEGYQSELGKIDLGHPLDVPVGKGYLITIRGI